MEKGLWTAKGVMLTLLGAASFTYAAQEYMSMKYDEAKNSAQSTEESLRVRVHEEVKVAQQDAPIFMPREPYRSSPLALKLSDDWSRLRVMEFMIWDSERVHLPPKDFVYTKPWASIPLDVRKEFDRSFEENFQRDLARGDLQSMREKKAKMGLHLKRDADGTVHK